ncbi:MAG: ZIP family metal transporter [Patescibacteria group bacterium]
MTILLAIVASIAAFLGGFIALRFRDKLHIILGLSAGAVIGAALFDLIPESISLVSGLYAPEQMTALTAGGFLLYLILDRIFSFHSHADESGLDEHGYDEVGEGRGDSGHRGTLGAASFCLHSLIDGIAIGVAFQASATIGTVVSIAVIAHRFSDGVNTIGLILKHAETNGVGKDSRAWAWLTAVAIAPIVGAASTFAVSVSSQSLAILLAVFAGFFLYIGASDLIPEGHHSHSKILTTAMTILGVVVLYLIVHFAHG